MGSRRDFPFNFVNSFATSPLNESFKNVLEKDSQLDDRNRISMRDNFDAICEATTVGRSSERVNRAMILVKASVIRLRRLHGFRFIQRKAYDSFHFEFVIAAYPKILYPRMERKLRAKRERER